MSQEIVYTSAPQGLKPSSRGFCTVIATQGMARNLTERLESLSGYRHAFAVHDENSHLNPVNYSHLKVTVGGQEYSVLSRICDAGQDYTGRTNKLAHHVALTRSERPPAGPAYQLQKPGFCVEEWDSQTRYTEMNCHHLSGDHPPLTQCTSWSRWCDAGWAGVLAQSVLEGKNQTQTIIFPVEAGSSTLALVAEALQLLSEKKRWEVTFSTYFTKLPAGVDCQWRFVLDGTLEADAARRNPRMQVIDLCADLGTAPEGTLVEAARTGQLPQQQNTETVIEFREAALIPPQEIVQQDSTEEFPDISESIPPVPPPIEKTRRASGPPPLEKHFQKPKKRGRKLLIGAGVVLLLLLSAGAGYLFMPEQSQDPETVAHTPKTAPRLKNKEALEVMEQARQKQAPKLILPEKEVKTTEVVIFDHSPLEAEKPKVSTSPIIVKQPLEDVRKKHHRVLPLPSNDHSLNSSSDPFELTKVFVKERQGCHLQILGSEIVLGDGSKFILEPISDKVRQWNVIKKSGSGFGQKVVGKFQLINNSLSFVWGKEPPEKWQYLKYCLLKITAGGDSVLCRLSKPITLNPKPLKLSFNSKKEKFKFPPEARPFPPSEYLQLLVSIKGISQKRLAGFNKFGVPAPTPLKLNGEYRASIFDPTAEGDSEKFLDLIVSLENIDSNTESGISIQAEAFGKELDSNHKEKQWHEITSLEHIDRKIDDCKKGITSSLSFLSKIEKEIAAQQDKVQEGQSIISKIESDSSLPKQDQQAFNYIKTFHIDYLNFFGLTSIKDAKNIQKNNESSLKKLDNKKNIYGMRKEFSEKNLSWCNKMLELFDQLEKNVTINYELFIEIEGEKVVIIKTSPGNKKQ
ncbi:hypothetical protein F1728_25470 [Gimesia benthica]|uniref:Uncharacterized protein n=1 Tax=Gimesia benthica TaxID=2608982 RepID=A0A6I6AI80_9PLAN|nr:hypothetical protein [Gimesia benthica]QGQ25816.1 hypothetical protein F1728_25470 [Gimesia benthica]